MRIVVREEVVVHVVVVIVIIVIGPEVLVVPPTIFAWRHWEGRMFLAPLANLDHQLTDALKDEEVAGGDGIELAHDDTRQADAGQSESSGEGTAVRSLRLDVISIISEEKAVRM